MEFWENINLQTTICKMSKDPNSVELLIKKLIPYIKTCAKNAQYRARKNKVFIPYEDFYSNFLLCCWESANAFLSMKNGKFSFQNIFLHRLWYAEVNTWEKYKKNDPTNEHKNGISYESARWENIDNYSQYLLITDHLSFTRILNQWNYYFEHHKQEFQFIRLLSFGFSSSEAACTVGICTNYDTKARKKVERIKKDFKKWLIQRSF